MRNVTKSRTHKTKKVEATGPLPVASSSSADRSRQALEQFERLVELDPAHRDRRLDALRQDDPALAAQVRQLLQADGETGFEAPLELLATGPATSQPVAGQRLGPYELERLLGEGGMGTVWFARRAEGGFEQRVAIKFLRGPALGSKAEQRFLNEWEVLGRLRHPAIVDILDTGWTAAGTPYLVMDYVDGEPIDAYCHQHGLTLRQRVRLLVKVCRAVSHAHRNLVVHRDLKPANILVTSSGEPRLLDFGIAKRMTGDAEALALTAEGISPMTLGYASPEQLRGNAVTTVSDVYSLGVLLYELLTGRRPFRVPSASPFDLGQAILERDAGPPSAEPDLIVHGGVEAGALRRLLRGDLDKITLLALGRDPEAPLSQRRCSGGRPGEVAGRPTGGGPGGFPALSMGQARPPPRLGRRRRGDGLPGSHGGCHRRHLEGKRG